MGLLEALGLTPRTPVASRARADGGNVADSGPSVGNAKGTVLDLVQQTNFNSGRVAAVALIEVLKNHPQKAAIQALIAQASTKLAAADASAARAEWPQAMQALEDVKALYATAKKAADDRQSFTVKLANAVMGRNAMQGFDNGTFTLLSNGINNAHAQAAAGNFVAANTTLDSLDVSLKANLKSWVDTVKAKLTKASANAAVAAFLKPEIDLAKSHVAAAAAAFGTGRWSECIMASVAALRALAPTERMAARRLSYEQARVKALAAIGAVKAAPAIADRGAGLDGLLAQADSSASRDAMRFEAGEAILADIVRRCAAIVAAGANTDVYKKQRPLADAELAVLDKHAAATRIAAAREAARKQLAEAAQAAAGAATAADPGPGWSAAVTTLVRVRTDLAAAKALADGAGSAAAAEAAASKPADVEAMKAALKTLQADRATTAAAPFAPEAAVPLKACKEQADKADKAVANNDGKAAAPALMQAAKWLVEAKAIQGAQTQFVATLPSVEARLAKLKVLPRAALLKGVIDAVTTALTEARAKNKAKAGVEAMAALRRATDFADAADKADIERGKFDTSAATTTTRVATITDAKAKKPLDDALASAKKLADAFKFGEATAALKKVEVGIDKAALTAKAAANPADPAIATLAAKMVANGGEAEIDNLIQAGTTTDPTMIAALATGRFGVTMVPDTSVSNAIEAKNMKALCKTFAKVPQHVKAAGSISQITHADATGADGIEGAWNTDTTVTLSGRPDVGKQKFGTALTKKVAGGGSVKQLPADIDKDCIATDDDSELLSFTALHEVGHGVDDVNTYMLRNGGREDHGGWVRYGASVQPIADAVGPHIRDKVKGGNTFYTKPEDRKYVLDKLLNQKPVRPATLVAGSADAKAYDEFDNWHRLATSPGIYERQGDCETITIANKTIYHQAYARDWVSYLAAARKKGLTGYQFRAPGEWFAELYAAFKANKLGPKHPAREWLKKL